MEDLAKRVTRQADTENTDTFKIVLLGDQVSFGCEVESDDVTEGNIGKTLRVLADSSSYSNEQILKFRTKIIVIKSIKVFSSLR